MKKNQSIQKHIELLGYIHFNDDMEKRKEKTDKPVNFERIDPTDLAKKWLKSKDISINRSRKMEIRKEESKPFRKEYKVSLHPVVIHCIIL